jgi:hypothetical protein
MACHLQVTLARHAPLAVIFRTGGTDWTRLILWHTDTDEFELGQWFKGWLYLPDLSPDGSLLIYGARKFKISIARQNEFGYCWTAISRPPYLTALALWPAAKPPRDLFLDFEGGGLFVDASTVWLNHSPLLASAHPSHRPKPDLKVIVPSQVNGELWHSESGDFYPWWFFSRLEIGWTVAQRLSYHRIDDRRVGVPWILKRPWLEAQKILEYYHDYGYGGEGRFYRLFDPSTDSGELLPDVEWADFDRGGRLAFSKAGALFVCPPGEPLAKARLLADFTMQKFEPIVAPGWATKW